MLPVLTCLCDIIQKYIERSDGVQRIIVWQTTAGTGKQHTPHQTPIAVSSCEYFFQEEEKSEEDSQILKILKDFLRTPLCVVTPFKGSGLQLLWFNLASS